MGKRGPKRQKGKREANGRLSRRLEDQAVRAIDQRSALDMAERATVAPGMAARHRVHEVPLETAVDQMAGSYVGRLRMARELTPEQYHAAEMYAREAEDYSFACASPRGPAAVDLDAMRGYGGAENVNRSLAAYEAYEASRRAVQARQNELGLHAHLFAALQYLVLNDLALSHLVADLKDALTALALHYGLIKPEKPKKALEQQSEAA